MGCAFLGPQSLQEISTPSLVVVVDFAGGPFYGYNRPGATVSRGVIENWWRQAMMGRAKAQYDGIKAFSDGLHRGPEGDRCPNAGHAW
jgi:hypothetical protein